MTTEAKTCTVCNVCKPYERFYKFAGGAGGRRPACIDCTRAYNTRYRQGNKEAIQAYKKQYASKYADVVKAYHVKHAERLKVQRNTRSNARYKSDPNYNIVRSLRSRLNRAMKRGQKTGSAIRDLGCSVFELKTHLESKFLPGMSWSVRSAWHIDHIRPLASFDLTDPDQLKQACHYTNLQPLWASDNLAKGAKWPAA